LQSIVPSKSLARIFIGCPEIRAVRILLNISSTTTTIKIPVTIIMTVAVHITVGLMEVDITADSTAAALADIIEGMSKSECASEPRCEIERDGFAIIPQVLNSEQRQELISDLGPVNGAGRRGLLALPNIAALARSNQLLDLIRPYLPAKPLPVRAIYFDKSPDANWLVPWHQDMTIALRERADVSGFGPWSVKEGVPHVQPPIEFLEKMLTIRLHLDDADETNGALRVLPGSHRLGRLTSEKIQKLRSQQQDSICAASAGDAILMRPLLLHASGRSTSERHRRILHIEYAAFALPPQLQWHEVA
jgi:hypothetical protein